MNTYNVGLNFGGIVGGQNNTVNNLGAGQKDELSLLLFQIQDVISQLEIFQEQREESKDYFDAIAEEAAQDNPKKTIIRVAFDGLKKFAMNDTLWGLVEKIIPIISTLIK